MAYNDKQKEYTMRYLKKLKEIRFRVSQEEYAEFEKFAHDNGYDSMRQFYLDAINEKIKNNPGD